MIRNRVLLLALVCCGSSLVKGLDWPTFKGCLVHPQPYNYICTLDASASEYTMLASEMPLTPVSGVTMQGGGTSPSSVVIQRAGNNGGNMIYIPSTTTGVTISNLTIDGNRYSFPNDQSYCTASNNAPACGPMGGYGCVGADPGPDVQTDGYATIDSVAFWNSPAFSLYMYSGSVTNSSFQYSRSTGAWIYNGGAGSSFTNNYMQYNGTGGLWAGGTNGVAVSGNTFFQNRWEMPDGQGGGQMYIGYYNANITAYQNTFDGNNWSTGSSNINGCYPPATAQYASGIEVDEYSSSNSLLSNEIHNQSAEGIDANDVSSLTISGYYPSYSSNPLYIYSNGGDAGISVQGTSTVSLISVLSHDNSSYGVHVSGGSSGSWTGASCVDSYSVPFGSVPNTTTCP